MKKLFYIVCLSLQIGALPAQAQEFCANMLGPRLTGTYQRFYNEGSGEFRYCQFNWGTAHCSGEGGCTAGTPIFLMSAHDFSGSDGEQGCNNHSCHVELWGCLQN